MNNKFNVIVADDDTLSVRGLLSELRAMKNIHSEIPQPRDGKGVLSLLNKKKYDFVFLDYLMPMMDGLETALAIKASGIKTNVIFHTEVSSEDDIKKILGAGFHVWLEKNCKYLNVQLAMDAALQGRPFLPNEINKMLIEQLLARDIRKAAEPNKLTKTEIEILIDMIRGFTTDSIAKKRIASPATINKHRHNIHEKTNEHTIYGLICYALEHKYVDSTFFFRREKMK